MARADLILNLIKAALNGDRAQIHKTVEAMAADERVKNHSILADRMAALLQQDNANRPKLVAPPSVRTNGHALFHEQIPQRSLNELVLPTEVEATIRQLIEEHHRADLLRSHGLEPRNRVLLTGPPGNGKTTVAEGIAEALSCPFLVVRYEAIIGSYLGETAQRIAQVFEHARTRQCVLFFDEFDAIGKERGDVHETGEIKRVVSSLLLQIDALPSYVIVVTASNHPELLDRAVWRRFQVRLELPKPAPAQIEVWLSRFLSRLPSDPGVTPKTIAQRLKGLSFAEIEDFGTDVQRRVALAGPNSDAKQIVNQCLSQWSKRIRPDDNSKKGG